MIVTEKHDPENLRVFFGCPDTFSRVWVYYHCSSVYTESVRTHMYACTHTQSLKQWRCFISQTNLILGKSLKPVAYNQSLVFPHFLTPELAISELIFSTDCKIKLHYLWNQALSISSGLLKSIKNTSGQKLSAYQSSTSAADCSTCSPHTAVTHFPMVVKNRRKQVILLPAEELRSLLWARSALPVWVGGKQRLSTCLPPGHSLSSSLSESLLKW